MSDRSSDSPNSGWQQVTFGQVVRQCKEKADPETSGLDRYVAGDHMDTDDLRLRRWGEIGSGYLGPAFHIRFKPGQVLYGSRRTYLRKVAVADFEGICANTTFVLEPKRPEELLPEFLPYLMQTPAFNTFSVDNSKGSVNPYINFSDLAQFRFSLPPISEQRRLVDLLHHLEASRTALADAVSAADTLANSIARDFLESTTAPRLSVGDVAKFASGDGIAVSLLSESETDDACVPVYGGNGIAGYCTTALSKVPRETVVIGRVGAYCGRVYYVQGDVWVSDNALYATSIASHLLPKYLEMCLAGANLNGLSTGGAQPLINQQIVKSVKLPVPDIDDQSAIVQRLRHVSSTKSSLLTRLGDAEALKRVVLSEVADV